MLIRCFTCQADPAGRWVKPPALIFIDEPPKALEREPWNSVFFSQAERPNYLVNSGYGSVQVSRALGCVDTYRIHRMMAARVTTAR
jgi:hypothetical protein